MKIAIIPRTHTLTQWSLLLAALQERYPNASIAPERLGEHTRMVLSVDDLEMSHDERVFLNSLSRPYIGPQTSMISDEVYEQGRSRLWLMESWYGLNKSIYDNL